MPFAVSQVMMTLLDGKKLYSFFQSARHRGQLALYAPKPDSIQRSVWAVDYRQFDTVSGDAPRKN